MNYADCICSRRERDRHYNRYRTHAQSERWKTLYNPMVAVLMDLQARRPASNVESRDKNAAVFCIDAEGESFLRRCQNPAKGKPIAGRKLRDFPVPAEGHLVVTMLRHGYMATAPTYPSLGISVKMLEWYDVLSRRCPTLSISGYAHGWCDFNGVRKTANNEVESDQVVDCIRQSHWELVQCSIRCLSGVTAPDTQEA